MSKDAFTPQACEIAKCAFDQAIAELHTQGIQMELIDNNLTFIQSRLGGAQSARLTSSAFMDSKFLMEALRKHLLQWSSEQHDQIDDMGMCICKSVIQYHDLLLAASFS